jgi:hypothetical protein
MSDLYTVDRKSVDSNPYSMGPPTCYRINIENNRKESFCLEFVYVLRLNQGGKWFKQLWKEVIYYINGVYGSRLHNLRF